MQVRFGWVSVALTVMPIAAVMLAVNLVRAKTSQQTLQFLNPQLCAIAGCEQLVLQSKTSKRGEFEC